MNVLKNNIIVRGNDMATGRSSMNSVLKLSLIALLAVMSVQPSFSATDGGAPVDDARASRSWNSWIKPALGVAGVGVATFTALTEYISYKRRYHCNQRNELSFRQYLHGKLAEDDYRLFDVSFIGWSHEFFDDKGYLQWYRFSHNSWEKYTMKPARKELLKEYREKYDHKLRLELIEQSLVEMHLDILLEDPTTRAACQEFLQENGDSEKNTTNEMRKRSVASKVTSSSASRKKVLDNANQKFKPILQALINQTGIAEQNAREMEKHERHATWYWELQEKPLGMKIGVSALIGVGVVGGVGVANKIISGGIWSTTQPPMSSIWKAQRPIK